MLSFEILEFCEYSEVIDREQYYLDILKPYDKGFNILKVAYSCLGVKQSKETILKRNASRKWYTPSEETKLKIGLANKGNVSPMKNKFGKDNHSSRAVLQYSKCGKFIKEFGSIKEAARYLNGEDSNIIRVCKGVRLTALGFKWKYK